MLWNIYSNIPNVLIGKPHHNPNLNGNDQIQTLKKIELISCITRNIHHRRLRKCKLENLYLINSTSVRTYTWPPHTFGILHTFSIRRSCLIFTHVRLVRICLQIFRLFFVCSAIFFRLLCKIFFFGIHLDFWLLHLKCYAHILCWHFVYTLHNCEGSGK